MNEYPRMKYRKEKNGTVSQCVVESKDAFDKLEAKSPGWVNNVDGLGAAGGYVADLDETPAPLSAEKLAVIKAESEASKRANEKPKA